MWHPAYIGIGSNLDGPAKQVEAAIDRLNEIDDTLVVQRSALYRSAPFGGIEQPEFVNAVAALLTQLDARSLLRELQAIEVRQGRTRGGARWGPRVIDLDLLVYSRERLTDENLIIPHPGIAERNFVLLPLKELAPEMNIPGLGRVADLTVDAEEPRIERIA